MSEPSADHVDLMFPNRYLKSGDLKGKDVPLTISKVEMEELTRTDGNEELKPVVHFAEMENRSGDDKKVLVLGKTTSRQIASLHGKRTADWRGKKITLYPTMVKAWGKMVEAIRVLTPDEILRRKKQNRRGA